MKPKVLPRTLSYENLQVDTRYQLDSQRIISYINVLIRYLAGERFSTYLGNQILEAEGSNIFNLSPTISLENLKSTSTSS